MPREDRIPFDEVERVYTVNGVRVPRSVTGFLHSFAHEFDALEAVQSTFAPVKEVDCFAAVALPPIVTLVSVSSCAPQVITGSTLSATTTVKVQVSVLAVG